MRTFLKLFTLISLVLIFISINIRYSRAESASYEDIKRIHLGDHKSINKYIKCRLTLVIVEVKRVGFAPFISPSCRGSIYMPKPMNVTVNMTDERYIPWGTSTKSVEVQLELLVGSTWLKPTGVKQRNVKGPIRKGALHVHILVSPDTENDYFQFFFHTNFPPSNVRLRVLDGPVYEFPLPKWK